MLQIEIPTLEYFDDAKQEFGTIKGVTLKLEHSLISLSKWESKWCKPFLIKQQRSNEEIRDYIRCMTINSDVDPLIYLNLTQENIDSIVKYIDAPMTATTISSGNRTGKNSEVTTSEIIYHWMISYNIPFECQKWHLNRLLTLIQVCNIKNSTQKKFRQNEILSQNRALNAARRKKFNTTG